jgi:Flp pilus assembly protein TadG
MLPNCVATRGKGVKKQAFKDRQTERGQSLVEMAVALPVLILLLVAVIDFARIIDASIVLTNAAREGARFASVDPSLSVSEIQQMVVSDVLGSGTNVTMMEDFATSNVTVVIDEGAGNVTVTLMYDFGLWFGPIVNFNTVGLTRVAVMPIL